MGKYEAVVIGVSSGGLEALRIVLPFLPADFPAPVLIVYHRGSQRDRFVIEYMNQLAGMEVKEAEEKEPLVPGFIYLAPPNYHLLVEEDRTLALSTEKRVSYSRPSIDILFETAAEAYGSGLVGLILTGANHDGAKGMKTLKERGGLALVQNPDTAEVGRMPRAAMKTAGADRILELREVGPYLRRLFGR